MVSVEQEVGKWRIGSCFEVKVHCNARSRAREIFFAWKRTYCRGVWTFFFVLPYNSAQAMKFSYSHPREFRRGKSAYAFATVVKHTYITHTNPYIYVSMCRCSVTHVRHEGRIKFVANDDDSYTTLRRRSIYSKSITRRQNFLYNT